MADLNNTAGDGATTETTNTETTDEKIVTTPAADQAASETDQETSEAEKAAAATEDDKAKTERKKSVSQRINEIKREYHNAERGKAVAEQRAVAAERELAELRRRGETIDPTDYIAQQAHETRLILKEETVAQERRQVTAAEQQKREAIAESFDAKVEETPSSVCRICRRRLSRFRGCRCR